MSTAPQFAAKFWDVIGLYLDPPEKAVVFCCDENGRPKDAPLTGTETATG